MQWQSKRVLVSACVRVYEYVCVLICECVRVSGCGCTAATKGESVWFFLPGYGLLAMNYHRRARTRHLSMHSLTTTAFFPIVFEKMTLPLYHQKTSHSSLSLSICVCFTLSRFPTDWLILIRRFCVWTVGLWSLIPSCWSWERQSKKTNYSAKFSSSPFWVVLIFLSLSATGNEQQRHQRHQLHQRH